MRPPLRRIPRSVVLAVLVAGIAVGLALVWDGRRGRPSDPRYQGRRASVWFDELVRTAGALGNDDQHLRHLEARIALLQLGTQAIPVLVDAALRTPPDGPLRRTLRRFTEEIGRGGFLPGSFAPPLRRLSQAEDLLTVLRPPAPLLLPWLEPSFGSGTPDEQRALVLLSHAPSSGPVVLSHLHPCFTRPATIDWAAMVLADAGPPPRETLDLVAAAAPKAAERFPLIRLLGTVQTNLATPPGWLEDTLTNTHFPLLDRVGAAVALLELAPDHAPASAVMRDIADHAGFTPWNELTNPPARVLCDLARSLWLAPIHHGATLEAVERLARAETDGWNERGLADTAGSALEKIAPDRAARLYEAQLNSSYRDNLRIVAAGSLLRVQRTNEAALRFLAAWTIKDHHLAGMAVEQLAEAHPDSLLARETLMQAIRDGPNPGIRSHALISLKKLEVRALEKRLPPRP